VTTLEHLGAADLRAVVLTYLDALVAHREPLNRLNVYPVPDGDTGTNMSLTVNTVCDEMAGTADADMTALCRAVSHGSLMGARGNSGIILSQVLRGLTNVIAEVNGCDGPSLAKALRTASDAAYQAVMRPVEGTILTVVRESAEGAITAADDGDPSLVFVAESAHRAAADALRRTPEMLPELADAGVVDAGGAGYLLLLDALLHVVDGRPLPEPSVGEGAIRPDAKFVHVAGDEPVEDSSDLRYEVMYFLEAPDESIPAFKDVWAGIGDSIVVVGGDGLWNCHIHTNDIGAAVEAALDAGRPREIRVTDLHEQVEEERWVREATGAGEVVEEPPHVQEPVTTAIVAVAAGDGIKRIFHSLGVQGIVAGGQSMNPSTAELLDQVERVPAEQVILLPNNKNIIAVAEQVDGQTDKRVGVLPTMDVTEGFSALMGYDPEASLDDNLAEMASMAETVVTGEVTQAVRDSTTPAGPIAEGDYMGLTRDGVRAVRPTVTEAATALLAELIGEEHEIVTIIEGEGSTPAHTRRITEWLSEHHPDINVEVHQGDQPFYPYLFGVE
jgi:uncharacterized protein